MVGDKALEGIVKYLEKTDKALRSSARILKSAVFIGVATASVYTGVLLSCEYIPYALAPKISTYSALEEALDKEKKKLGIENTRITLFLTTGKYVALSRKFGNSYDIILSEDERDRSLLRHELYHIADGHCDALNDIESDLLAKLAYFFYYEPQAAIYAATGLQL